MRMSFDPLITKLGITLSENKALDLAFIHRSYLNESKAIRISNERLEFLGDSILSFLVSQFLYRTYPDLAEGELTALRSSLVKTKSLYEIAKELDLGVYLKLSRGEDESGGRTNPSILADTFEALLGAIYLDQGLDSVEKVIQGFLLPKLTEIIQKQSHRDAKSSFQELVQEKTKISPTYKVISEIGPDHAKTFTVGVYIAETLHGKGMGKSKQEAEQFAAADALENWPKS